MLSKLLSKLLFAQHVKEHFIANNAEKCTAKPIAIALTVNCNDYKNDFLSF